MKNKQKFNKGIVFWIAGALSLIAFFASCLVLIINSNKNREKTAVWNEKQEEYLSNVAEEVRLNKEIIFSSEIVVYSGIKNLFETQEKNIDRIIYSFNFNNQFYSFFNSGIDTNDIINTYLVNSRTLFESFQTKIAIQLTILEEFNMTSATKAKTSALNEEVNKWNKNVKYYDLTKK